MKARISELFFSIQGEGLLVGTPQIFIRFFGCNLNCSYCDTRPRSFRCYSVSGLMGQTERLGAHGARWVSITGGEPLIQSEFLGAFTSELKAKKYFVYLETNGILVSNLRKIQDRIDAIAMDIKLPDAGGHEFWKEHAAFLRACRNRKRLCVKVVIGPSSREEYLSKAVRIISSVDPRVPLVLQPDSRFPGSSLRRCLRFWPLAAAELEDVRIIPQVHKLIGVR